MQAGGLDVPDPSNTSVSRLYVGVANHVGACGRSRIIHCLRKVCQIPGIAQTLTKQCICTAQSKYKRVRKATFSSMAGE